jgi:hypothetical protein
LARPASVRGSRSPAISAATIATDDLAFSPPVTTEVILIMASSSSFSSRCRQRVRSRTRSVRARVKSRTRRIAAGGTKLGRSSPSWVSRASHIASSLPVFGRPLEVLGLRRGDQLDRQADAFQHVIPHAPVIGGALQRHHLHLVPE